MQRIVILGNAGSGKSTLAQFLGNRLGLPVIHLDTLFWEPRWTKPTDVAFRARVTSAIARDRWICEGNYARQSFELRLPRADIVVWLNTPRITCCIRVLLRALKRGDRPDLPVGCHERLDAQFVGFLRYVWDFDRRSRPLIEAEARKWGPLVPIVHLRGQREISAFLNARA